MKIKGYSFEKKGEYYHLDSALVLEGATNIKLPESLQSIGGSLVLRNAKDIKLPESLQSIGGSLVLEGATNITFPDGRTTENYPIVTNCGQSNRTIFLTLFDKDKIQIGCTQYTKEGAMNAINSEYASPSAKEYCDNVRECFAMWETMKAQEVI
jgi:hypothetical protein